MLFSLKPNRFYMFPRGAEHILKSRALTFYFYRFIQVDEMENTVILLAILKLNAFYISFFAKLNDVHFIFKVANHGHNAETCNDASMKLFLCRQRSRTFGYF